jgi:predicted nucleotidyltransferase
MFERLFTSRTRARILELFLSNPGLRIHLREISRRIGENYNSTRRELNHLEGLSLLASQKSGNQRLFSMNTGHPIYPELKNIFLKTAGMGNGIREAFKNLGGLRLCFIYGSYAEDAETPQSDLDLFIVGEVDEVRLIPVVNGLEKRLHREINYVLYTPEEYMRRKRGKDPFVTNVLEGKKVMLQGDENEL